MPCTPEAVDVLRKANVSVAPSMAAGLGGVRDILQPSVLLQVLMSLYQEMHLVGFETVLCFWWLYHIGYAHY